LSRRQLIALFVVLFVTAGSIVGYLSQNQTLLPSMVPGPAGYGALKATPAVEQQTVASFTMFSSTVTDGGTAAPTSSFSTSFGGRMVELQGYITLQVDDARAVSDQAARLAASLNGYVASSSFDESGSSASIVLRVPEGNFSMAMRSLTILGKVLSQSISSDDVTEQYVNVQAQLDSYMTEEGALLRILNSSKTIQDALDTESTLQNVQSQINDLEGQLRTMQRLVAFSTISVDLTQPTKNPTLDLGDAVQAALLAFYTVTKGMLILAASIAPIAVVGGIVYIPFRHFSRKKPSEPVEAK